MTEIFLFDKDLIHHFFGENSSFCSRWGCSVTSWTYFSYNIDPHQHRSGEFLQTHFWKSSRDNHAAHLWTRHFHTVAWPHVPAQVRHHFIFTDKKINLWNKQTNNQYSQFGHFASRTFAVCWTRIFSFASQAENFGILTSMRTLCILLNSRRPKLFLHCGSRFRSSSRQQDDRASSLWVCINSVLEDAEEERKGEEGGEEAWFEVPFLSCSLSSSWWHCLSGFLWGP